MAVNVATGTVSLTFKDISIPGKFPLEWHRHYSTALLNAPQSQLGPGWTSPYFSGLTRIGKDWHFHNADGQPIVYSGEPTGNGANNASNSLGVAAKDEGRMSTNKDPANVIPPRKPAEFGGKQKDAAMFAIDSDVLAEHGLIAVPFDGPDDPHIGIQVADGISPETLPERLAATKEHWKPITPEEVKKQLEAEAKKDGGCSG